MGMIAATLALSYAEIMRVKHQSISSDRNFPRNWLQSYLRVPRLAPNDSTSHRAFRVRRSGSR